MKEAYDKASSYRVFIHVNIGRLNNHLRIRLYTNMYRFIQFKRYFNKVKVYTNLKVQAHITMCIPIGWKLIALWSVLHAIQL